MKSISASLIAAAALLQQVQAHFTLDYPLSRGFDEDIEPEFCGGFPNAGGRVAFPLNGGPLVIDSHHSAAVVGAYISLDANPANFSDFNTTSSGATIPLLLPFGNIQGEGEFCFQVNVSALNIAGVTNGTNATIQVQFNGGDDNLFQCSDVYFSSDFTASNVTCKNGTAPDGQSESAAGSSSAPAPTSTGGNNGAVGLGISGVAVGFVGALAYFTL